MCCTLIISDRSQNLAWPTFKIFMTKHNRRLILIFYIEEKQIKFSNVECLLLGLCKL